jgi:hypothetical protein
VSDLPLVGSAWGKSDNFLSESFRWAKFSFA